MKKLFIVTIIFLALISSGYAVLTDGIIRYYNFEQDASVSNAKLIDVVSGRNLTKYGTGVLNITGIIGNAWLVNATGLTTGANDSYISDLPNMSANRSFNYWAYDLSTGSGTFATYMRYGAAATNGLWFDSVNSGNHGIDFSSDFHTLKARNASTWHMITLVYDNSTGNITGYYDGVLTTNFAKALKTGDGTPQHFSVFWASISATTTIDARIDEAGIWNRPLSSTEINYLFAGGTGMTYPFLDTNLSITNSTYNMTSDGGCGAWNATALGYCPTTDGTPTVSFLTNSIANCSLRSVSHSYNESLAKCSTTGTTSHVCTIIDADKLIFGTQSLYATCYGTSVLEVQSNFSSPALPINMTAGSGGGLISCITTIGSGCGVAISGNCSAIIHT